VPTRLLGWSAAGTFVLVLGWSALMQGRGAPSAYAAAQPVASPELAAPALDPSLPVDSQEPEGPPAPWRIPAAVSIESKASPKPARAASDSIQRNAERAATIKEAQSKAATMARAKMLEPSAATAHKVILPVVPAQKPVKLAARKRIDQEFGF